MELEEITTLFCKKNSINISELREQNNRPKTSNLRKKLAIQLNSFGGHPDEIARILNRDRTTVLYYLRGNVVAKEKYDEKRLLNKAIEKKNEFLRKIAAIDEFIDNYVGKTL